MRNLYGPDKPAPDFKHCLEDPEKEKLSSKTTFHDEDLGDKRHSFEEKNIELTGCEVTTMFHNNKIYFVLTGYEKGVPFIDGSCAQGKQILRIYRMGKGPLERPNILMIDEVLNNTKFDYTNYRNYNPILKHGKSIYYWKIHNDRAT